VASTFYSTLEPVSFVLSPDLTGAERAELAVELQFYGLLDRVMPYYEQEQIGVALLKRAGTTRALQSAVAAARALVVEMGSTTPWFTDEFQDARYVITDRVVNDMPAWAAENGANFMYRANNGQLWIGSNENCAEGRSFGWMYNTAKSPEVLAPTQLPSDKWKSIKMATLGPQFRSGGGTKGHPWVSVPPDIMRVTAVHGLDDGHPAMAAALLQLTALTAHGDA